jgi:hypothetical protein
MKFNVSAARYTPEVTVSVVNQVNLYRGFLAICHPEDPHLSVVDRYVELASGLCMREWRRLPHIVSHIHLPLLQAAQQVTYSRGAGSGAPGIDTFKYRTISVTHAISYHVMMLADSG